MTALTSKNKLIFSETFFQCIVFLDLERSSVEMFVSAKVSAIEMNFNTAENLDVFLAFTSCKEADQLSSLYYLAQKSMDTQEAALMRLSYCFA